MLGHKNLHRAGSYNQNENHDLESIESLRIDLCYRHTKKEVHYKANLFLVYN